MWSSKDIALIVCMAGLGFVSTLFVAQMAGLITGIPGANFVFTVVLAIQTGFSFLMYEGRRWRFLAQFSLFTLLVIPTYLSGPPYSPTKANFLITAFFADLFINSIYGNFKKRNMLKYWSVVSGIVFWVMLPFSALLIMPLFYNAEYIALFVNVVLLLLPVIVIESIVGGYLGYRIYRTVRKSSLT